MKIILYRLIDYAKFFLRGTFVDHYRVLFFATKNKDVEITFLKFLCIKDKSSIDVGAAVGFYTHFILKHSKFCFCFEVNSQRAKRLESIFSNKRVKVEEVALSNKKEISFLQTPIENGSLSLGRASIESENHFHGVETKKLKVNTNTLDNFNLKNIGFIKIDVEGHEFSVLEGSKSLLIAQSPNLLIELEERHKKNAIQSVTLFLINIGYHGIFFYKDNILSINDFDSNIHQNIKYISDKSNYVNNFIYTKDLDVINKIKNYIAN